MLMRYAAMAVEGVFFLPASLFLLKTLYNDISNKKLLVLWSGIMMLGPALFIDHGHYMYN
jgi:hypothetical protein